MAKSPFLEKLSERIARVDKEELFHLLSDISQEKTAMESVLQSLGDGIILMDPSGRVLFANRTCISLLGLTGKSPAGSPIQSLVLDPGLAELFLSESLETAQAVHREIQVYAPRAMLLSLNLLPIRGERGGIIGTAAVLRDITEKRRIEGRMAQSEKLGALSLLAAGLAHEIGNPLNSINIHLQLIAREIKKLKGTKKVQKLQETVQEEIKRLDDIVHRFLTAIRPLKPRFEQRDINGVIRDVFRLLKHELAEHAVKVDLQLGEHVTSTLLDVAHLKQAIINLVKNAMQAMPKGGKLLVWTGMQDGSVRIQIQDSGMGIAPEHISRIFDPYFTTRQSGSGLGLMMTHRIVKEHGGEIEVKSESGKGTTFILTLPVRSSQPKMITAKAGK